MATFTKEEIENLSLNEIGTNSIASKLYSLFVGKGMDSKSAVKSVVDSIERLESKGLEPQILRELKTYLYQDPSQ